MLDITRYNNTDIQASFIILKVWQQHVKACKHVEDIAVEQIARPQRANP